MTEEKLSTKSAFAWLAFILIALAAFPWMRLYLWLDGIWQRRKVRA